MCYNVSAERTGGNKTKTASQPSDNQGNIAQLAAEITDLRQKLKQIEPWQEELTYYAGRPCSATYQGRIDELNEKIYDMGKDYALAKYSSYGILGRMESVLREKEKQYASLTGGSAVPTIDSGSKSSSNAALREEALREKQRLSANSVKEKTTAVTQPAAPTAKPAPAEKPVVQDVADRVSTWLESNNTYLEDYNARFGSRKGDFSDAYVGDAQAYLDTVNQRNKTFAAEAKAIRDLMNQNRSVLKPEWITAVNQMLDAETEKHAKIWQRAVQDADYWAQFKPNEEQAAAGDTAENLYKAWQAEQQQYAEDLALDITAAKADIKALEKEIEDLDAYYDTAQDTLLDYACDREAYAAKKAELYKKYGGNVQGLAAYIEEKKQQLKEKKQQIERAEYVQGYKRYMDYKNEKDYAANSQYVSTRTNVAMEDAEYKYNKPTWGGETLTYYLYDDKKLFGDFLYDYINGNQDARTAGDVYESAHGERYKFYKTMSKDEIGVFNYLYKNQGKEAANDYLGYIESNLKGRERAQEQAQWAAYAKEDPVGSSIFSVLMKPAQGMDYLGQALDMLTTGKIDQNAEYNRTSRMISAIRSQVSTTIEQSGKWGKVGSFAYNTGMSMADFLFTTAISGGNQGLSLAIMGTGAAADATLAAKDRGLSDSEAFTLGTIAGLAEVAMEKVSLGAWLNGNMTDSVLRYTLKNALSEGLEEAGTSVINLLADIIIAKDKSEWNVAMQEHIKQGKSKEEAFGLVLVEEAAKIGLDTLGGILSGGTIGGGTSVAVNSYNTITGNNKMVAQNAPVTVNVGTQDKVSRERADIGTKTNSVSATEEKTGNIKESITQQLRSNQAMLSKMDPVADIQTPANFEKMNISEKMMWVVEKLRSTNYKVNRKGFGTIMLTAKQLKSAFNYFTKGGIEEASFEAVPYVLEHGEEIASREDHKGRGYGTVTIAAPVTINGKRGNMAVVVKRTTDNYYKVHRILTPDGKVFHLADTTEAEPTPAGESPNNGSLATPISSASTNSISENGQIVNAADGAANRGRKVGWDGREVVKEATGPKVTVDGKTYVLLGYDENGSKVYQDAEVLKEQAAKEKTAENQDKATQTENGQEAVENSKDRDILTLSTRYLNKNDSLYEYSGKITPLEGFEDVVTHGDPISLVFKDADGKESNVSAEEFVQILKDDPNYKGGNIRLVACQVAANGGAIPKYIAKELGVTVIAPTESVNVDWDGNMLLADDEANERRGIETGEWLVFEPGKEGVSYDLYWRIRGIVTG